MKKEEITALGISEELAEKVVKLHDDEINGAFIPKHRFDEVNNAKKALEETVKERDKQLETLKKSEGDVEALKQQIADLQTANKEAAKAHEAEMVKLKTDNAIESVLASSGAKNTKAIRALFDESNFKLQEDGTVFGLKEALSAVQKSDPYLFETKETKPDPKGMTGFEPKGDEGKAGGTAQPSTYAQWCEHFANGN
jgi:hypothetical protein